MVADNNETIQPAKREKNQIQINQYLCVYFMLCSVFLKTKFIFRYQSPKPTPSAESPQPNKAIPVMTNMTTT